MRGRQMWALDRFLALCASVGVRVGVLNSNFLALIVSKILAFIWTDGVFVHDHLSKLNLRVCLPLEKMIKVPCIVQELLIYVKQTGQRLCSCRTSPSKKKYVLANRIWFVLIQFF